MSIVIALEMGLVQAIVAKKGDSITAAEIATATGSEKLLVGKSRVH